MQTRGLMRRPCKDCGVMFVPFGRFVRFCERCNIERRKASRIKAKLTFKTKTYYFPHKIERFIKYKNI